MSSVNGTPFNAPSSLGQGVQMGNMGEGGGTNFFMGQEEEQYPEDEYGNPELVVHDAAKEKAETQNRQFLEELILGENNPRWINPWEVPADKRSRATKKTERSDMRIKPSNVAGKKMFIINA